MTIRFNRRGTQRGKAATKIVVVVLVIKNGNSRTKKRKRPHGALVARIELAIAGWPWEEVTRDDWEQKRIEFVSKVWTDPFMSIVRKSQIVGATTGALLTNSIQLLVEAYAHGESLGSYLLGLPWELILLPAGYISSILGMHWQIGGNYVPRTFLCLMVVTNSTLCALFGTLVGWCLGCRSRSKGQ